MKGNLLKYWDGSAWKPVNGTSGGTGPSTAAELPAVVPADMVGAPKENAQALMDQIYQNSVHLTLQNVGEKKENRYTLAHNVSWKGWVGFRDYQDVRVLGYGFSGSVGNFMCGDPTLPLILRGKGVYQAVGKEQKEIALKEKSVQLPDSGNGTAGQFAVSDGKGGVNWLTLINRSEVGA